MNQTEQDNNLSLSQIINQLTMQIFADRYKVNLTIKETDKKNNKERKLKISCSSYIEE